MADIFTLLRTFVSSKDKKESNPFYCTDYTLKAVLLDIISWYTPKKTKSSPNGWVKRFDADLPQLSYKYFKQKLCLNHQRIRRILVELENKDILKRIFRTIKIKGVTYNNVMYIELNLDFLKSVLKRKDQQNAVDLLFKKNTTQTVDSQNNNAIKEKLARSKKNGKLSCPPSLHNNQTNTNRIIKNNSKYRSIKSTFSNNENDRDDVSEKKEITSRRKKQDLAAFYPLKQEDNEQLQQMSGRGFSLNAMNEILQSIAFKLKGRAFWTKHCFMKYFSKILEHEMRDAEKCSNVDFRIKANLSEEELEESQQEKYLTEIESSTDSSKIVRWKQKLIGRLSASRAYELLQSLKSAKLNGQSFEVEFSRDIQLSSYEEEQILKSAREVYEQYDYQTGQGVAVTEIRLVQAEATKKSPSLDFALGYSNHHQGQKLSLPQNILGKIRQRLIKHFGSEGLALDKSWFSKLRLEDDGKNNGQVRMSSTSKFVSDWINQNYSGVIEKFIEKENYKSIAIY